MSIRSFFARLSSGAAVAAMLCVSGIVSAADVTPQVVAAAPVYVGEAPAGCETCQSGQPCQTCQHGLAKAHCSVCNKGLLGRRSQTPYQVNLCPGACFGYFQTQWRKWDEVCPYPYTGTGVSDAPRQPAGILNPLPGGQLSPPRPVDPRMVPEPKKMPEPMKSGRALPPIPTPDKFAR